MNQLITLDSCVLTMSSREIADLVESRHDSVKRTIERLVASGVIQQPPTVEVKNHLSQTVQEYRLIKRDSYIVVAQLSPEFTARLVDRWQELEQNQAIDPMRALNDPATMRGLLLSYSEKVIDLEQKVSEMLPQNEAFKRISFAEGKMCITDAAKTLQVQPKRLFNYLSENLWIYRRSGNKNWIAYQDRIQTGLLEHKVTTITTSDGDERVQQQVLVTPKGLARLAQHFCHVEAA